MLTAIFRSRIVFSFMLKGIPKLHCRTLIIASAFGGQTSVLLDSRKRQMPCRSKFIYGISRPKEAWGHASMSLSDGTHISWWPCGKDERKSVKGNAVKAPPMQGMTLTDDIEFEGGKEPDVTRIIPSGSINEAAIKSWWQSFSKKEEYRAFDQNCSTVVFKALCAGSALDLFPADEKRKYESSVVIWTPISVDDFVQRLIECITNEVQGFGCFAWTS